MAKMEQSVLAVDSIFEFEEENVVNERENSQQLAEEPILFVQKKLHQRDFENVSVFLYPNLSTLLYFFFCSKLRYELIDFNAKMS